MSDEMRPRDVVCPQCGAEVGAPCRSKTGGRAVYHRPRTKLAARGGTPRMVEQEGQVRAYGQAMVPLAVKLPPELIAQLPAVPGKRSAFIRDAVRLRLEGEATRWQRRFEAEREARLRAERRLERAREALNE